MQAGEICFNMYRKISMLLDIAKGLKAIHDHGYINRDFHSRIGLLDLSESFEEKEDENSKSCDTQKYDILISDLELCIELSSNSSHDKKLYGVIHYIASELLSNNNGNEDEKEEICTFQ